VAKYKKRNAVCVCGAAGGQVVVERWCAGNLPNAGEEGVRVAGRQKVSSHGTW